MGTPKAALEWHGSTLLRRTAGVLARATGGPVVVVRAPGQELPELPPGTLVTDDPHEGKGPVQGIAAGLAALRGRADVAFVSSTDLPFLHPVFVERVLRALGGFDVVLPVARGYQQPLAAAYRVSLADTAQRLVKEDRLRPAFLFAECAVARLDDAGLLADPLLAAVDPDLDSLVNVNEPADYQAARARPAPEVTVRLAGPGRPGDARLVRAATVQEAVKAAGVTFGGHVTAVLNGGQAGDEQLPLVAGDSLVLSADWRLGERALPRGIPRRRLTGQRRRASAGCARQPARLALAAREGAFPVSIEENKAVVGRWFTELRGKDFNPAVIDELAAPNIRFEYSLHAPLRGRAAVRAFTEKVPRRVPRPELPGDRRPDRRGRLRGRSAGRRHPRPSGSRVCQVAASYAKSPPRPALSGLPRLVTVLAADGARAVAGGDGGRLVGEEDAVTGVPAAGDRAQRGRAVEAAVDLGPVVTAPPPLGVRPVRPAVGAKQHVSHGASWKTSPSVCRRPDLITDTPCRTGAADQPRADLTGRSRVVNT
jgi:molybdopterin-guanine dinucleotide biosynthesis protein A